MKREKKDEEEREGRLDGSEREGVPPAVFLFNEEHFFLSHTQLYLGGLSRNEDRQRIRRFRELAYPFSFPRLGILSGFVAVNQLAWLREGGGRLWLEMAKVDKLRKG